MYLEAKGREAGEVYVLADPLELRQVLLNLVANALEAMPQGGSLVLETGVGEVTVDKEEEGKERRVLGRRPEEIGPEWAWLRVADTGVGIPAEQLAHLGEAYYTTRERGSGLGLFIVRQIVEQTGGWIEVSSAPGKGTTVVVYLPLCRRGSGLMG